MVELLTSDPAILLFSSVGLVATAISIVRDARAQREAQRRPLAVDNVRPLVTDEVRVEAA